MCRDARPERSAHPAKEPGDGRHLRAHGSASHGGARRGIRARAEERAGKTTLLKAELGGAAVVPGPGDLDGTAEVKVSARPGELKICIRMEYELGVGRATEIHIHEGDIGEAGPALATLYEEAVGGAPGPSLIIGCEGKMPKPVVKRVVEHPRRFYIDLHTLDFPDGALRGQLHS